MESLKIYGKHWSNIVHLRLKLVYRCTDVYKMSHLDYFRLEKKLEFYQNICKLLFWQYFLDYKNTRISKRKKKNKTSPAKLQTGPRRHLLVVLPIRFTKPRRRRREPAWLKCVWCKIHRSIYLFRHVRSVDHSVADIKMKPQKRGKNSGNLSICSTDSDDHDSPVKRRKVRNKFLYYEDQVG